MNEMDRKNEHTKINNQSTQQKQAAKVNNKSKQFK